jgi:hypothetical protein
MTSRRIHRLSIAAASMTFLALVATAVPSSAQAAPLAAPTVRPLTVGVLDVAKGAYEAYGKYQDCLANIKVDQPCTASDSDNIRAILSRMAAFEQKLEEDKKEATARFELLQETLNDKILDDYVAELVVLDVNGTNALKAYEALSACLAVATDLAATCQAYIGGIGLEKPQSVKQAVAESEAYFLEQVEFMGINIDANVAVFTGTSLRKGMDGLASAAWKMSKGKQEKELKVSSGTVMSAGTSSVITRTTADSVNQYLDYYEQVFDRYGFLLVTAAGLKSGDAAARKFQATVGRTIIADTDRYSLRGTTKRYRLPVMQDGEIAVVLDQNPMIISGKPGLGHDLTSTDITNLATTLNNYSKTATIADNVPGAFPADRLYTVKQHVSSFNKTIYTCAFLTGCLYTDEVQSHALGGSSDPTCLVQMRPMNSKPAWDSSFETWMYADSSMPRNYFMHVHDTYAKGSVDYPWATRSLTGSRATYKYGWGALVTCDPTTPASSAHMLDPAWYPLMK